MIIVKANIARARSKLTNLRKGVHRTAPEVLESEGRIVAVSLAKSTQPFGAGADAKDMGERAVSRDIGKVYATIGDVFDSLPDVGEGDAAQFWKLIKLGKFDAAQRIVSRTGSKSGNIAIGNFDGGALHRSARNAITGRVSQKNPSLIVADPRNLMSYAQRKIGFVGFGKSAWATIARQLGGIRGLRAPKLSGGDSDITANWITRKGAPGRISRNYGNVAHPSLTLTSGVRYGGHILSPIAYRRAVGIARGRIIKQIEIAARYEMRQVMRRAA